MSQTYTADCFTSSDAAQTNMGEVEENFATLRSSNSGASAPSNLESGLQWFDTGTGGTTYGLLKVRVEAADDPLAAGAWYAVFSGTAAAKIWMYRNDSDAGWVVDSGVTDRVLALKGAGGLYNVNGGNSAGESWANLKAHTHTDGTGSHYHSMGAHNHYVYNYTAPNTAGQIYDGAGAAQDITDTNQGTANNIVVMNAADGTSRSIATDWQTNNASGNTGSTGSANTGAQSTSDVRPAAAVGTLQYPVI